MVYQETLKNSCREELIKVTILVSNLSTEITNKSVLLYYVRYKYENAIFEDILFVTTVVHTTAEDIFCKINGFIRSNEIEWIKWVRSNRWCSRNVRKIYWIKKNHTIIVAFITKP